MRRQGFSFLSVFVGCVAWTTATAGPIEQSTQKNVQMEQAPACDPRWYFSIGGGGDFNIGSTRINDRQMTDFIPVTVAGVGTFDTGSVNIKAHDFDQVYDTGYHVEGEFGYSLTQYLDIFARLRYSHADATDRTRGSTFTIGFPVFATFPISSEFDDYNSFGGEVGFRIYFTTRQARFRPYIALSGGASHVDAIGIRTFADLTSVGGPPDQEVYRGAFFDDSVVGTAAAVLGIEYNIGCHFTIGINGGARYETRLEADDHDLNTHGFTFNGTTVTNFSFANQTNNNSGDRLTAPVTGYLKFRF